jgi:hypothetical protein
MQNLGAEQVQVNVGQKYDISKFTWLFVCPVISHPFNANLLNIPCLADKGGVPAGIPSQDGRTARLRATDPQPSTDRKVAVQDPLARRVPPLGFSLSSNTGRR